jgi:hypothetical protein
MRLSRASDFGDAIPVGKGPENSSIEPIGSDKERLLRPKQSKARIEPVIEAENDNQYPCRSYGNRQESICPQARAELPPLNWRRLLESDDAFPCASRRSNELCCGRA